MYAFGFVTLVLAFASPAPESQPAVAEIPAKFRDYPFIAGPVFVNPALARLCRGASEQEVEAARLKAGPHAHTEVRIFMNDLAAATFREKKEYYPVGSVVVKEKMMLPYHKAGGMAHDPDGVGGMVKREPGYDPEHGDWEYFYYEDSKKIESGRIESCVKCHAAAKDRDYVFGDWSKPEIRRKAP